LSFGHIPAFKLLSEGQKSLWSVDITTRDVSQYISKWIHIAQSQTK